VQNTSEQTLQLGDAVQVNGLAAPLSGLQTPVIQVALASPGETVFGIVVGKTEMYMVKPGLDDVQPGAHFGKVSGDAAPGDYLVIVVQGFAQVRTADTGINAGDLVYLDSKGVSTTGSGDTFGMALDTVDTDGLVWVMVGFH
jgi:hypothetical protein